MEPSLFVEDGKINVITCSCSLQVNDKRKRDDDDEGDADERQSDEKTDAKPTKDGLAGSTIDPLDNEDDDEDFAAMYWVALLSRTIHSKMN